MDWSRGRVRLGIRERAVLVYDRCCAAAGRHNECFEIEAANEIPNGSPVRIALHVALVPGQAEWCIGTLNDE